jgi:hypothetical protein
MSDLIKGNKEFILRSKKKLHLLQIFQKECQTETIMIDYFLQISNIFILGGHRKDKNGLFGRGLDKRKENKNIFSQL